MTDLHKRSQFTLLLDTEELKRLKEEAMKQGIGTNKYINVILERRRG
jgi:predicted DNA binding CopG/RHH family protein